MLDRARGLAAAIVNGNGVKVKEYLEDGTVDLNSAPFAGLTLEGRFSLLQFAANAGQKNIVQLLLEHGADPEARDGSYGTALQVAAGIRENQEVVGVLLEYGAKVDADPHWFGNALQIAVNVPGNEATTQLLLNHGADVNAKVGRYHTALQTAARVSNNGKQLELLLERGADATIRGGQYGTALQAAAFGGDEGALRLLLPQSAGIINAVGGQFGSALNAAALSGNIAAIRLLLEHGADLKLVAPSPSKASLLHFAVAARNPSSITEFLLDNGAAIHLNIKNADGETPLFRSITSKTRHDVSTAKLLLERGASADNDNYAGIFPLEYAVQENDLPMARLLYCYAEKSRERLNISQWRNCFGVGPDSCILLTGGESPDIVCIQNDKVIERYVNASLWRCPTRTGNRNTDNHPVETEEPIRAIAMPNSWIRRSNQAFDFSCRWWRRTFGAWEIQTYGAPSITAVREPLAENCFLECSLSILVPDIPSPGVISTQYPMSSKSLRQERVMGITWIMRKRNLLQSDEAQNGVKDIFAVNLQSFLYLHSSEYAKIPSSAMELVSEFLKEIYKIRWNTLASLDQLTIEMRASVLKYGGTNPKLVRHLILDAQLIDDVRANHKKQVTAINLFCDRVSETIASFREENKTNSQNFLQELAAVSDASQKAIQLEFNLTSINEAQKSTSTSRSMKRLSWTTFVFLPLLFVASLFGMNIDILATNPPWWWYIPFAFAATFTTLVVWLVFKRSEMRLKFEYFDDSDSDFANSIR